MMPGRRGGRGSSGQAAGTGRRCSLATFTATARGRSGSRGAPLGLEAATELELESCRPPLEELPTVAGYEGATFEPTTVAPPDGSEATTVEEEVQPIVDPIRAAAAGAVPDEGRLRALLRQYAAASCARDGAAASGMKMVALQPRPVYKYSLETFAERRQVSWSFEPHTGGDPEADAGEAPAPWRVEAAAPPPFRSAALAVEVPRSGAVRTCASCGGVGSRRCGACAAAGWERCPQCLGDGHKSSLQGRRERCFACLGTGRKRCWKCCGDTIAACRGCAGTGQIRCFLVVNVSWTSHAADSVVAEEQEGGVGKKLLERASGIRVFEQEGRMVAPAAEGGLRRASAELLEKQRAALAGRERILRQRHRAEAVPVLRVDYEWRRRAGALFVYGAEERVLAPHFPEAPCCCALL